MIKTLLSFEEMACEVCLICLVEHENPTPKTEIRICGYPDFICDSCRTAGWSSRKGTGGDYSIVTNNLTKSKFYHPDEVQHRISKCNNDTANRLKYYKSLSLYAKVNLFDVISEMKRV